MKRFGLNTILFAAVLALCIQPLGASAAGAPQQQQVQTANWTPSMVSLMCGMRQLWIDHVVWTRNYIVSAVAGAADQKPVLARLLRNQQDIGNAVKPYYGEAAGNRLAELLREHILIAGKIVGAAKAGKQAEVAKLNKDWHRNADDIAKFMSRANPYWSEQELRNLLYTHLQLVSDAAVARIKKDYAADIQAYDKGVAHVLMIADATSSGIMKQFPNRFLRNG